MGSKHRVATSICKVAKTNCLPRYFHANLWPDTVVANKVLATVCGRAILLFLSQSKFKFLISQIIGGINSTSDMALWPTHEPKIFC